MEIALLDNKKSIKQLVGVDTNKSILESIEKELAKKEYNFIVTADDIPKAKKLLADLNKSKEIIDTFRKTKAASESLNINLLKDNCDAYINLFDAKREEIKKKFEVFEKEKKAKITKELSLYTDEAIKNANLRYDFTKVDTADLIVFGSVTAKGALTKKAKETIEGRVMACKSKQDKYDMRLKDLEIESRKAGLEAILTITHVQGIIMLDDDNEYNVKLNELISSEIERHDTIKANIQRDANEKAQRDAHQEVLDGQNRINSIFNDIANRSNLDVDSKIDLISNYEYDKFSQLEGFARAKGQMVISELNAYKNSLKPTEVIVNDKEIPITHETIPKDTPKVEDGKKIVKIQAVFEVEVPSHVPESAVLEKVRSRLSECDINSDTLKSLEVV